MQLPISFSARRLTVAAAALGLAVLLAACAKSGPTPPHDSTTKVAEASPVGISFQTAVDLAITNRSTAGDKRAKALNRWTVAGATSSDQVQAIADLKLAVADDRAAVYNFDADVRKLGFADSVRIDVNTLLTEDGKLIAILDKLPTVSSAASYDSIVAEENTEVRAWRAAIDKVAQDVNVAGTKNVRTTTSTTRGAAAGQVLHGSGYHLTAPVGFSGHGGGTIELSTTDRSVTISAGTITGYSGTLAEVAKQYVDAVANKQHSTIAAAAINEDTGAGPGVGYRVTDSKGNFDLIVVVGKDNKFVAIELYGPTAAATAQLPVFAMTLGTFGFDN